MIFRTFIIASLLATLSACSMVAPKYTPSVATVSQLKSAGLKSVGIGPITADPALGSNNNSIGLRGSSLNSPYASYSAYLEEALRNEFQAAGLLDPNSSTKISGSLIKNDVNIGGFFTGDAIVEARIQVKRGDAIIFDKLKSSSMQFDSSFAGAIAIPKGRDMYPIAVQKFIELLAADADFINSIK